MTDNSRWTNVSFTPDNQRKVEFTDVNVRFPTAENFLNENASENPEGITGPIGIRIEASRIGSIAMFTQGQVGIFQGIWLGTRCIYTAVNAKVYLSTQEVLVLDAESLDKVTSPVSLGSPANHDQEI
jgi:hypothetical protein